MKPGLKFPGAFVGTVWLIGTAALGQQLPQVAGRGEVCLDIAPNANCAMKCTLCPETKPAPPAIGGRQEPGPQPKQYTGPRELVYFAIRIGDDRDVDLEGPFPMTDQQRIDQKVSRTPDATKKYGPNVRVVSATTSGSQRCILLYRYPNSEKIAVDTFSNEASLNSAKASLEARGSRIATAPTCKAAKAG